MKQQTITAHMAELRRQMKKVLKTERFDHTLGVAYTAASLAFLYDVDLDQALTAGMLHDCAKYVEHKVETCKKFHIPVTEAEEKEPSLLHAKLGAYLAEHEYHVQDPEVLNAIRYHTTGHPNMTLLEKIIFVADYIEPNRKMLPHLSEIRKMAYRDLNEAIVHILQDTLAYLDQSSKIKDPETQRTLQYYLSVQSN